MEDLTPTTPYEGAFQVNARVQRKQRKDKRRRANKLRREQRRIEARLALAKEMEDQDRPLLSSRRVRYELADRTKAIAQGGIGAMHQIALQSGLVRRIDEKLHVLKLHRPYHESDHVLNIAYNSACGGQTLDDIELRRNDEAFLDALGTPAIPDPTTAGDFCRRFHEADVDDLMEAINETRVEVWKRQSADFTQETARIDADGTFVGTGGECKEGMDISRKGVWGYHPLLVSLANTREPLFIYNRGANRPSHEGAAGYFDRAVALCRRAGFTDILLRGDTDFSLTTNFDRWDRDGVRFIFGYDAIAILRNCADSKAEHEYRELERKARHAFDAGRKPRSKQPRVKEEIVRQRGFENIKLVSEDVAEFAYCPKACVLAYRMVVVRKNLTVEKGDVALFDDVRYFFYVTNDWGLPADQVVREANERCNQENLIEQLKNGVRALHAPVNTLNANWAYMVMASLAWTLKAWMALSLPVLPRWKERHQRERERWLRMEFRTFCNSVINIPAQVVTTGRRLVLRLLGWRPQLPVLFRLLDGL